MDSFKTSTENPRRNLSDGKNPRLLLYVTSAETKSLLYLSTKCYALILASQYVKRCRS